MSLFNKILRKIIQKIYSIGASKKRQVLFESNGPYDNSYVLFLYTMRNRKDINSYFWCPDYFISWKKPNKKIYKFSPNKKTKIGRVLAYYRICGFASRCETIFSSYFTIKPTRSTTKYVYVNHGVSIKGVKKYFNTVLASGCDIVLPSKECESIFRKYYDFCNNRIIITPPPRLDALKQRISSSDKFYDLVPLNKGEKIVLSLLTFRREENGKPNLSYLFPDFVNLDLLDNLLKGLNIKLVFKLHHVLDSLDLSSLNHFKNIIFLKNKDIFAIGLNTTSILLYADAFLTDYSGAISDCVILNKQIGFFTHDINSYKGVNQGFMVDNPLDYLPGKHINNYEDLKVFFNDVVVANDGYKDQRKKASVFYNGLKENLECCSELLINKYYPK